MESRPIYFIILRAAQALLGLIVLALAANFIHGAVTEEQVLALVCGLFSMFAAAFGIASDRIPALQSKIILLVGMGADAVLAILWLASMGANARLRSLLTVPVQCSYSYSNGGVVNSNICVTKRTNPYLVAGPFARATIEAVAALSAFECVMFVATLIITFLFVRRQDAATTNSTAAQYNKGLEADVVPMQSQPMQPMVAPEQQMYQNQGYQPPVQQFPAPVQQHQVSPVQGYVSPVSRSPPPQAGYELPAQPYQGPPHQGQQYPAPTSTPVPQPHHQAPVELGATNMR